MKTTKILLLLTTISFFTAITTSANAARDCANPRGFHDKMMCKLTGQSVASTDSSTSSSNVSGERCKTFACVWKRAKNK